MSPSRFAKNGRLWDNVAAARWWILSASEFPVDALLSLGNPQSWWVMETLSRQSWQSRLFGDEARHFVLLGIQVALFCLLVRYDVYQRVAAFLDLPFYEAGISQALSHIRLQFIEGLAAGVWILLSLTLATLASSKETRRWIIFFALIWQGRPLMDALLIFLTCDNLRSDSGVPAAWQPDGHSAWQGVTWMVILLYVILFIGFEGRSRIGRRAKELAVRPQFGTGLEQLSLSGTNTSDATLEHMDQMTCLRALWLNGTQITDAGLAHLEAVVSLEELHLERTRITDAGLATLQGLPNLKLLDVRDTVVTVAGVADLKRALPQLDVVM